ncbi:MAG: hypothetical protein ACK5KM_04940 [Hyphomicrobiaceae bacterium]
MRTSLFLVASDRNNAHSHARILFDSEYRVIRRLHPAVEVRKAHSFPGFLGLLGEKKLDRVHVSRNRAHALFSFILAVFFTPNRLHFG